MTVKTLIPPTDEESDNLGLLIDRRRGGAFVDLDQGEVETRTMLERKRKARAVP